MKIRLTHIFTIVVISANLLAQNSVHLKDKLLYKNPAKTITQNHLTITNGTNSLTKTVFGFLPYWELDSTIIRMDLLSHIALFDFVLNEDGSLTPPYNWPEAWQPITDAAHRNNVKLILTVSNLTDKAVDSLLVSNLINNQSAKEIFFSDVKTIISEYNFDGINLDFENPKLSERGDPINNFTQELRDSLNMWFIEKELSFATPAVNWGSRWKLKELSEICDYLFIMAYDYHGSWSTNAGPVAPLSGNTPYNQYNYKTTIENDYAGIKPSKLILGVPYYGAFWRTESEDIYSTVDSTNWIGSVDYRDIDWTTFKNTINFDDNSQSTYLLTQIENKYDLIWIDTELSLELKYDFALEKNLRGVGMWSLGKDGNYPELWNLIEKKFTETTSVEKENLPKEFILYQNYPNPFNPSTTIKFTIPSAETQHAVSLHTKLVVYDIIGREVATLVNQRLQPGNHKVQFDANSLSSGMYIYRIDVKGKYSSVKKMLLLK